MDTTVLDISVTLDYGTESDIPAVLSPELKLLTKQWAYIAAVYMQDFGLYFISTVGIILNILSLLIFGTTKSLRGGVTPFLISISILDTLALLSAFTVKAKYLSAIRSEWFCTFSLGIVMVSSEASDLLKVIVGIMRSLVVVFPFRCRQQGESSRWAVYVVGTVTLYFGLHTYIMSTKRSMSNTVAGICDYFMDISFAQKVFGVYLTFQQGVNITILSVCSIIMFHSLTKQRKCLSTMNSTDLAKARREIQIGKMLLGICVLYLATSAFPIVLMIVNSQSDWMFKSMEHMALSKLLFQIGFNLKNVGLASNTIVYMLSSSLFRAKARQVLLCNNTKCKGKMSGHVSKDTTQTTGVAKS